MKKVFRVPEQPPDDLQEQRWEAQHRWVPTAHQQCAYRAPVTALVPLLGIATFVREGLMETQQTAQTDPINQQLRQNKGHGRGRRSPPGMGWVLWALGLQRRSCGRRFWAWGGWRRAALEALSFKKVELLKQRRVTPPKLVLLLTSSPWSMIRIHY